MAMSSSLQQRAVGKTCSNSTAAAEDVSTSTEKNDNHKRHSFESCFSAGLDLSEFATTSNNNIIVSASAELAQSKQKAVARRNIEEKAEYELERRVANVLDATKYSTDSCNDHRLGDVVPRAVNPNNNILATNEYEYHNEYDSTKEVGRGREDNFVQFQDGTSDNKNEFLSCLISNHKVEQTEGRISTSHKSRMTKKKNMQNNKNSLFGSSSGGGRQHSKKKMTSGGSTTSRKVVSKKSRKSKY